MEGLGTRLDYIVSLHCPWQITSYSRHNRNLNDDMLPIFVHSSLKVHHCSYGMIYLRLIDYLNKCSLPIYASK